MVDPYAVDSSYFTGAWLFHVSLQSLAHGQLQHVVKFWVHQQRVKNEISDCEFMENCGNCGNAWLISRQSTKQKLEFLKNYFFDMKSIFYNALYLVPKNKLGTAYGFMQAIQNCKCRAIFQLYMWIYIYMWCGINAYARIKISIYQEKVYTQKMWLIIFISVGLALTAMLSGVIVDKGGYLQLLMFFLCFQMLAMISIAVLWKRHGPNCKPLAHETTRN